MTSVVRTLGRDCPAELGLGALLTAYHLRTEEEKGAAVADVDALTHAAGVSTVAFAVWSWRTGALGLYEKLGFAVVDSWDERDDLVCMERAVRPTDNV
jgi:hypothetical protein